MNTLIRFFWIFISGCFLGSILETVWCFIKDKKLSKRKDLIYGYFTSMYGIAGTIIVGVIELFNIKNLFVIFLISFFVSGIVEYSTSYIQEKSMGVLFWDYSKMKFNLHGRVNLFYLIGFGIFGIIWLVLYPFILKFIYLIISNRIILIICSVILCIFMIFNFLISYLVGIRQKKRRKQIKAKNKFEVWIDNNFTDEYMRKIYPNLEFVDEKQS